MKKIMISQPIAGLTHDEIVDSRDKFLEFAQSHNWKVVNTLFTDDWYSAKKMAKRGVVQTPLCFLAKSLENMANCHAVYFAKGWENARGCKIEYEVAKQYGLQIIFEYSI